MSNNRDGPIDRYARDLAAKAYPKADDLTGVPGFRRKWVLRLSANLPADEALEDAVGSLNSLLVSKSPALWE